MFIKGRRRIPYLPSSSIGSGIGAVTAKIIASGRRDLDAFFVVQGHNHVLLHERSRGATNPRYHLPKLSPGRYEIEFAVCR